MREPLMNTKVAVIGADEETKRYVSERSIITVTWLAEKEDIISEYHFVIDITESDTAIVEADSEKYRMMVSDADKKYMLNAFITLNVDTIDCGEIDFADQIKVYHPSCEYRREVSNSSDMEEVRKALGNLLPDRIKAIIVFIVIRSDADEFAKALIFDEKLGDVVYSKTKTGDPHMERDISFIITSGDNMQENVEISIWCR